MLIKIMRKKVKTMRDPLFYRLPEGMNPELKELVYMERARYKLEFFFKKLLMIWLLFLFVMLNLFILLKHSVLLIVAGFLFLLAGITFMFYIRYKKMRFTYKGGWVRIGGVVRE